MGTAARQAALMPAKRSLPPGPRGFRFLLKLMRAPEGWLDFLARCTQDYGDLVYFKVFGVPACLINNPAALEQVLVTESQNFTKSMDYRALSRVLGQGLLTSEGEVWKKQRRLIQPAFFRDRILSYGGIMTEYTARLTEAWKDGEVRDIHRDMMRVTLQIAARS